MHYKHTILNGNIECSFIFNIFNWNQPFMTIEKGNIPKI